MGLFKSPVSSQPSKASACHIFKLFAAVTLQVHIYFEQKFNFFPPFAQILAFSKQPICKYLAQRVSHLQRVTLKTILDPA